MIFKLSRGEYVAPDKVEDIYKRSPYIAQVSMYSSYVALYQYNLFLRFLFTEIL